MRSDRFKTVLLTIFICSLILLILLVGCTTIIEDEETTDKTTLDQASKEQVTEELPFESEKKESKETISEEIPVKAAVQPGMCEPSWKCISSKYKAHQDVNCAFTKKTECPLGCFNNTCKAGKTCEVGFKCITETWSGYQKEDCDWINKKLCENSCSDGECLNATQSNLTGSMDSAAEGSSSSSSSEEESSSSSSETFSILKYGDKTTIDYHNMSIYLLEVEKVKITLDGKNSNWLLVGESYARNGLNVTIKEIMFQSYNEGTKAISYTTK